MKILSQKERPISASTEPYSTISTTTSLGRVRGFTVDLVFHLKDGPKRCCDLAEITGKYHCYVWRYLKNMQNYGLVEKQGLLWNLSVLGEDFLSYLNIVYNNIIEYRKKIERSTKEVRKKINTSRPKRHKQVSISLFLRDSKLDDTEKEVVEVLVNHYNKTGSKFILIKDEYELANKLSKNPQGILQALVNLRQDNIIYLMRAHDFPGYHKLGLKRDFVTLLEGEKGISHAR